MRKPSRRKPKTLLGIIGALLMALLFYLVQGKTGNAESAKKNSGKSSSAVSSSVTAPAPAASTEASNPSASKGKSAPASSASQTQVRSDHRRSRWHQSNLQRHWEKHRAEFPEYHSAEEYGEGTVDFVDNPPEGTLRKTTAEGDQMFYHPPSNRFAVVTADGNIKTCFKPDQGMRYWNRQ
ncbi:MAG: hypothetical protein IKS83_09580 [Victivallales bacterium]|nr:hypothetical protein [Victivallales bacterium]